MITPVSILTINQICDRKNDLLVSADDIKEIADNAKNKAIDDFSKQMLVVTKRYGELYQGLIPTTILLSGIPDVTKFIKERDEDGNT